jgi:phosphoribosyl 1,2-cyclic phosphodiesterase
VRGSCPCSSDAHQRYGGNTPCVIVEVGSDPPIILDLGTGLRPLGLELDASGACDDGVDLVCFLSHLHWDHIIGLPFFTTAHHPGTTLDVYGPPQVGGSLHDLFDRVLHPPFFPINVEELNGRVRFHEALSDDVMVGRAKITVRKVPHVGTTLGFRIEADGASVAFVSDHQQPEDRSHVDRGVLELCDGADLVIHDAQYTEQEFLAKSYWGHSTIAYAVHVASEAGARQLAMFHHDPLHVDDDIDRLLGEARALEEASGLEKVIAASEGLSLEVGRSARGADALYPYCSRASARASLLGLRGMGAANGLVNGSRGLLGSDEVPPVGAPGPLGAPQKGTPARGNA